MKPAVENCPYSVESFIYNLEEISWASRVKLPQKGEWTAPPALDVLKFNVDKACKGNSSESRIGGVLRNHKEHILGCFSKQVGYHWAFKHEVLAISMPCFSANNQY